MNDSPARIDPEEAAIRRPTQTARRLVEVSGSPNTRRAYAGALRRLDAWLDARELRTRSRGSSTCRPPSVTWLSTLPPRHAGRST